MSRCVVHEAPAPFGLPVRVGLVICLILLTALAGCGSRPAQHARVHYNPSRYYPPPGPRSDPWGPYIHEASGRFGVPERWVRSVMRQESDGQEDVISWAGAMGLMQVMPETYEGLRDRYNLGDDPFDPHNNILAGTAYLREMYDRFGAPGFLAAYNAGPNRLDLYLNNGRPLPDETVNYVAAIAPQLGPGTPMSGPLAVYAGSTSRFAARATPSGCDVDAAYNPNGPCTPLPSSTAQPVAIAAAAPVYAPAYGQNACDPDAAYDPTRPCRPAPTIAPAVAYVPARSSSDPCDPDAAYDPARRCRPPSAAMTVAYAPPSRLIGPCDPEAAFDPARPCRPATAAPTAVYAQTLPAPMQPPPAPVAQRAPAYRTALRPLQERMAQPVAFAAEPPRRWAVQVGAFANLATAQAAAEKARSVAPDILRTAKVELRATTPFGTQVAFRARLFGLSPTEAAAACSRLSARGVNCLTVPPSDNAF